MTTFNHTVHKILEANNYNVYDISYITHRSNQRIEYMDKNHKYHRIDGPAVIESNGSKKWYIHGNLHRLDGPAEIHMPNDKDKGYEAWYTDNKIHRENGPAIKYNDGRERWYVNDKLHREDGPAVVNNNSAYYYLNGEYCTKEYFDNYCKQKLIKTITTKENSLFTKEFLDEF